MCNRKHRSPASVLCADYLEGLEDPEGQVRRGVEVVEGPLEGLLGDQAEGEAEDLPSS